MSKFLSGLFGSLIKTATPIEKVFKNTCFLKDTFDEMDYDDLLKVLHFLLGKTEIKQADAIMQFFNYIKEQGDMSLQRRLKILALIHKSVKKIGYEFAEAFLDARPGQLRERSSAAQAKQSKAKQIVFHYMDIESWLEEYLIKHYYDYLMRMSLNLETYKACLQSNGEKEHTGTRNTTSEPLNLNSNPSQTKEGKKLVSVNNNNNHPKLSESQQQQQQQPASQQQSPDSSQMPFGEASNALKIIILFKVNNLVNFVIKLQKQFYIVFTEFKFIAVVKDIAHMILKDCVTYYNFMHRNIMTMVNNYESMVENDQMNFYELFIELIKLNSSLHDFGKLRKYFDEEESIDQPLVLNITKERARQIDRNHRKIVLRNEEIQRDRKIKLQQQMQGTDKNSTGSTYGKRLSLFPKAGSMTSRVTSWKPDDQICEVTNDDEDDEVKTKFKINPKLNLLMSHQQSPVNGVNGVQKIVPNLNLEHMYGLQMEKPSSDAGGFNTDRVTYSRHFQDDKSDSTKDTKKDDETENNKSGMKEQGNE